VIVDDIASIFSDISTSNGSGYGSPSGRNKSRSIAAPGISSVKTLAAAPIDFKEMPSSASLPA